jgi:hypothetical protein
MSEQPILDQPEAKQKPKRPWAITLICLLWAVYCLFTIHIWYYYDWYKMKELNHIMIYNIEWGLMDLISLTGIWKMKKWGVYLFTGFFLLNMAIGLVYIDEITASDFILPAIITVVTLFHFKKMR